MSGGKNVVHTLDNPNRISPMTDSNPVHDPINRRFQLTVDGEACVLDYRLAGDVMTITHTGVPKRLEGQGLASRLMHAALDAARVAGWKVVPACAYAAAFMQRHPEFKSLLAG